MPYQTIELVRADRLAVVRLNRPEALNAISTALAGELLQAMEELGEDDSVFGAILTGQGDKAFCVGADLKERRQMTREEMNRQRVLFGRMFRSVAEFPKPLLAAVRGYALGGGLELAMGCDFILAADNAGFGLPEVGLAIIPGGGGTQLLPRIIGRSKAKELIFTGRRFTAAEALDMGLVSRVVAAPALEEAARELMQEIIKNGPVALREAKKAINLGVELDLHTALALEAECYNVCLATEDRDEGLKAFNEKRPPRYRGR